MVATTCRVGVTWCRVAPTARYSVLHCNLLQGAAGYCSTGCTSSHATVDSIIISATIINATSVGVNTNYIIIINNTDVIINTNAIVNINATIIINHNITRTNITTINIITTNSTNSNNLVAVSRPVTPALRPVPLGGGTYHLMVVGPFGPVGTSSS